MALTPIQRWFFETHTVNPHHFNQSVLVELSDGVDESALATALAALPVHHDALRTRFSPGPDGWVQTVSPPDAAAVLQRRELPRTDEEAAIERYADEVHAGFDLTRGRLFRAVLLGRDRQRPLLLLVAHHLVIDGVSWRILLDDLDTAYQQVRRGESVDLGARTTSFQEWAHRLAAHVAAGGLAAEEAYWTAALPDGGPPTTADAAGPAGQPPAELRSVTVTIDEQDTDALLRTAPGAYRTRINDVLLAALASALSRWTGSRRVHVQLEGHGREELLDGADLSRTVGWFTTMFPVALDVPATPHDWRALIKSVRRQLRAVPGNGIGFGALAYLGGDEIRQRLSRAAGAQVVFNYLGQWDARAADSGTALVHATLPSPGREHDPRDRRPHGLDVVGSVQDGVLQFTWYHPAEHYPAGTVETVAEDFADALRAIAADCRGAA